MQSPPSVHQVLLGVEEAIAQGGELFTVGELLHRAQINGFPVEAHTVPAQRFELYPLAALKRRGGLGAAVKGRYAGGLQGSIGEGKGAGGLLGPGGDVVGHIPIHLDHTVGGVEVGPRTPRHQNGGDAMLLIEFPDALQEGGNGLHIPVNDLLHQRIPHHEVGGAGILVHEKEGGTSLQALHHIGRLGGAAASVLGGEVNGVLAVGQVVDEEGDVGVTDAPPILRPDFYRSRIGDDIFPAISGNMGVDPQLQSLEQGGFSVIAPAHNKGNTPLDTHTGERTPVGQIERYLQLGWRLEGNGVLEGERGDAGGPGQNTAVGHKSTQSQLGQHGADILLVLCQIGHSLELPGIQIAVEEGGGSATGQQFKEYFLQFPGVDGPAIGGESHLQSEHYIAVFGV